MFGGLKATESLMLGVWSHTIVTLSQAHSGALSRFEDESSGDALSVRLLTAFRSLTGGCLIGWRVSWRWSLEGCLCPPCLGLRRSRLLC
jgi:hypothetical protein